MKTHEICFSLNGEKVSVAVGPAEVLLDVLRGKLGVKSAKSGCERGDCGACTVIMNGRTVRACLVLAEEAAGSSITTLEGANDGAVTRRLQEALHRRNAFQCGFCAPGMILSATELLEKNPAPSVRDIKEAISGNLCRCTGYEPVVEAIDEAARAAAKPGRRAGKKPGGKI